VTAADRKQIFNVESDITVDAQNQQLVLLFQALSSAAG
jgi:hypothetical protein